MNTVHSRRGAFPLLMLAAVTAVGVVAMSGGNAPTAVAAVCDPSATEPSWTPGPGETPDPCPLPVSSDIPQESATPGPDPSGGGWVEQPLDADGSDHASGFVTSGGSVSTDGANDYATPGDPVETRVSVPNDATVSIDEVPAAAAAAAGYPVIGQQVNIVTPDAGPPSPYPVQIDFVLDPSIWATADPSAIRVVRDGELVPECDNRSYIASPDPCEVFYNTRLMGDDRWINIWSTAGTASYLFVVLPAVDSAGATVAAGDTVTTDSEGNGATVGDQVETTIETPVAGTITISEGLASAPAPTGFTFAGQEILIEAPVASAAAPLRLTFTLDSSAMNGESIDALQVFRNGTLLGNCTSSDGSATPDPCVAARISLAGDAQIVVLTSHASRWNLATRPAYPFVGFFQPIDGGAGSTTVLNVMTAGAAVPVKFSLGGDEGLAILAGQPSSTRIACTTAATDVVETTSAAATSSLRYDAATGQYIFTWKTDRSWAGTCRRLTVRLADGASHTADFSFRK